MYYIYEISGVKIGCSQNPDKRVKSQGYNNWIILEQHEDIMVASSREIELQKEKGYRVDPLPYYEMVNRATKGRLNVDQENKTRSIKEACSISHFHKNEVWRNLQNSWGSQKTIDAVRKGSGLIVTCPHCNKVGRNSGMKRWHFNNCPKKETQLT